MISHLRQIKVFCVRSNMNWNAGISIWGVVQWISEDWLENKIKCYEDELDNVLELQESAHLDCPAEWDFTITLGKVHVPSAEVCTLNKHRKVYLWTSAKIFYVTIPPILPSRNCPCSLISNPFPLRSLCFDLQNNLIVDYVEIISYVCRDRWHDELIKYTLPSWHPFVEGRFASGLVCKTSHNFSDLWPVSSSSLSLWFHILRSSAEGAVPIMPGWVKPGNRTPVIHKGQVFE